MEAVGFGPRRMRPKIALPVLVLGALLVAAVLWLRPQAPVPPPAQTPGAEAPPTPAPEVAAAVPKAQSAEGAPAPIVAGPEASQRAYVAQRVAELQDLASDNTPASLDTIVSELTNRDPEIRRAAREAAVQFGSRDAIPKLMDAAAQTDDPQEKVALQDAINFLQLPTPAELAASGKIGPGLPPRAGANPALRIR